MNISCVYPDSGPDSFTYTISDGNGGTDTASVTITVNAVNLDPVAMNDAATVNQDSSITIDVLSNDSDPNSDTLTISGVSGTGATQGSVSTSGNQVQYTPTSGYYGPASFTYTISDGNGGSHSATVNITVVGISFISTWETTAPNESITIPLVSGYNYDLTVNWGDGTTNTTIASYTTLSHNYVNPGIHTITITGVMEAFAFVYGGDKDKIISVLQLGNMGWKSFKHGFTECAKLETFVAGVNSGTNLLDMSYMFSNSEALISVDLSHMDTSNVTDMSYMFSNSSPTTITFNNFDTSSVITMLSMFSSAYAVTNLDLSSFNTSNVVNMNNMFEAAHQLSTLDVSNFNTSKVNNMAGMFYSTSLSSLDLSHFDTSLVTDMSQMFYSMSLLSSINLSSFNTLKVTSMSQMFHGASILVNLDLSSFVTPVLTSMHAMFNNNYDLVTLDISNFVTNEVTSMSNMFFKAYSITSLDLSHFNTAKVTNMMNMFNLTSSLTSLNTNGHDLSAITHSSGIFTSKNASLVVTCDQASGNYFGENCI